MCGITGWIDNERNLLQYKNIIENMSKTLKERGPDQTDTWLSSHAALGHTRLIVIDPVGGQQPMVRQYGNRKYVITYNGELYNTKELRAELESKGHRFYSSSDTEVLLVAYIEWEEKSVEKLNGIYAFAVWDELKQRLFMARDRLGVKPLFYTQRENYLLYGSELKAILAHPDVRPEIGEEGLLEVFGLGPSRTPGHGIFKGISELRPGHYLIYENDNVKIKRYWQVESRQHLDDLNTTIERVNGLVNDAVGRQLISDVPVCTFLSGGLDSSIISAIAANKYKDKGEILNTYSVDYIDNSLHFIESEFQPNSDAPWIKGMSEYIQSNHHYINLDNTKLVEALQSAVIARDLPGMADVDSSLYLFSKEIKKNATVGLSGECADEIFGGYPWFYREADLHSNTFPWLRSVKERENILAPYLRNKFSIEDYVQQKYQETIMEVPKLASESKAQSRTRELFYLNMTWFMSTLLERKDRMTMATGLEVRVPFADHRLVEYAWNIPWEMKNLGNREKGLLREAMKGILPSEITNRKKSPYPKTHNPVYARLVSDGMQTIMDDSTSPILDLIDRSTINELIKSKGGNLTTPWFGQLMTGPQLLAYLIQINIWLKEYNVSVKI